MTIFEITSIIGLFMGPLFGVWLAYWLQDRSARSARKLEIFKTLMRTRRAQLSAEHVGALNLVEIEFHDDKSVQSNFQELFNNFSVNDRRSNELYLTSDSDAEKENKDVIYGSRMGRERQELLAKLLKSMAKNLKYDLDQLDVIKGGYSPQYHEDVETENKIIRKYIVSLSRGNLAVPIFLVNTDDPPKKLAAEGKL